MSQEISYKIVVEGGIKVLYKGVWVNEIPFDTDEITVGVMDPENNIYPDINLRQYRLDGGDPYISRRHARFLRKENQYLIEDICRNNSTSINNKSDIINGVTRILEPGTRVFISESIVLSFEKVDEQSKQEESTSKAEEEKSPFPSGSDEFQEEVAPAENLVEKEEEKLSAAESPEQKTPSLYLEVAGQILLFFKPRNIFTSVMELNPLEWSVDEDGLRAIHIGRRSTEDRIYPDIDLWKFYFNDGDEYIARRHARIFEKEGKFYFQDISGKGSTWYNEKDEEHRLVRTLENPAVVEIKAGDKLIISDSATFIVCSK